MTIMISDPSTRMRAEFCRREELGGDDADELRRLLMEHFDGVEEAQFAADLREKSHVLRIWKGGELVGFSTLLAYQREIGGENFNILYSGDTIMSPACWRSPVLARGWMAMVLVLQRTMPAGRCLWLLLSAGFRTYRFLPVFWRGFWPQYGATMPPEVRSLRDQIAGERFGEAFDAGAGLVRFPRPHRLRGALADLPESRLDDPHVAFFLEANPGWREGDELVCLTEIDPSNLTPAGLRMVRPKDR